MIRTISISVINKSIFDWTPVCYLILLIWTDQMIFNYVPMIKVYKLAST